MRRTVVIAGCIALIAATLFVVWIAQPRPAMSSGSGLFRETLRSAMTNSVELVKKEITGGVGIMVMNQPGGELVIRGVGVGSPGEQAGLNVGDIIIRVNDWPTAGHTLQENIERVRGYTAGKVVLIVQRGDPTNLIECVIRRTSWNTLNGMKYDQTPGTKK